VTTLGPLFAGLLLFASATVIGIWPIKKIIQMVEAKHELKQGSAGYLRTLSGWAVIAFWIMATWFLATILGDWHTYGDLDAAIGRAWRRFEVLLHIAAALGDN